MEWWIAEDSEELADRAAREIAAAVAAEPAMGLALPTGRTPVGCYRRLAELHAAGRCSFADATVFALDEYVGLAPDDPRSFGAYLRRHVLDRVDLPEERLRVLCSSPWPQEASRAEREEGLAAECRRYESALAGVGLGLAVLGLGSNGHIGFNEPGSSFESRTRVVHLTEATRRANAEAFGGVDQVPEQAMTLGIATLLEARRILLLVAGHGKGDAVERLRHRSADPTLPASALQLHRDVLVLADRTSIHRAPR